MIFQVLTYMNSPINHSKLSEGFYTASIPTLYDMKTTIQDIEDTFIRIMGGDIKGDPMAESWVENLRKCELKTVELQFI